MSKEMLGRYLIALYETIKEAGKDGAPEGPMYMAFMQSGGVSLEMYQKMASILIEAKLVRRYNNCLIALEQPNV